MTLNSNQLPEYPDVSVIILTYNGSEYIEPLLDSLLNQSYPQECTEILVVDNASTDETLSITRKNFSTVKVIALEKNIGYAAGNNQGLLHASHNLLVFLNQDTVCHPDFLESLVNVMLADKTLAACNPNIITPDQKELSDFNKNKYQKYLFLCDLSPFGYGQNRIISQKAIYYTKLLSGCAFIIRRETVSKLGYLFDDRLWMYAEDTDLSLRIHNLGQKTGAIRGSIVFHLHNKNMNIKKTKLLLAAQAIMNRLYVFYKNMGGLEFLIYLPILFLGGSFKILEFPLATSRKFLYFLPFSFFSMICMSIAIWGLPEFASKRRRIISS
ncbi:MAG: glycosyltransferase family 2 protein, partial [Desulfobacterales bacterium]